MTKIQVLPPEEARKIAAGEVIDRPAALVREFVDNAIDAGSTRIEVAIEGGGSLKVEVSDNGEGISRDDLELCCLTHATSKIRSLDDLKAVETLGFRGEALAAAAAVARLEIASSQDGREGWLLTVGPGDAPARLTPKSRSQGTSVRALGLFDAVPARKRFLKREGAEGLNCRQIFNDKAMAFPGLGFRFVQDGKLRAHITPVSSYKERFAQILLTQEEGSFLHEIFATGDGFSAVIVVGGAALSRPDRRQQFVFANGRRIQDFSLTQALEYGLQGWFPNGTHPVGAIYLDINPALADFNIHPAKREARFADAGAIHHAISSVLRDFAHHQDQINYRPLPEIEEEEFDPSRIPALGFEPPGGREGNSPGAGLFAPWGAPSGEPAEAGTYAYPASGLPGEGGGGIPGDSERAGALTALLGAEGERPAAPGSGGVAWAAEDRPAYAASGPGRPYAAPAAPGSAYAGVPYRQDPPTLGSLRYLGRLFELFILVERGDRLYIIDQHAAHERVLYDRLMTGPIPRQELLVAIPFTTDSNEEDSFLETRRADLEKLGVVIQGEDQGWRIEALPAGWRLSDTQTVAEILKLKTAGENMAEHWAATLCCHGAVRDGDYLDPGSALALAAAALKAPLRRCPHGRPIWFEISRDEVLRAVRRL